MKKTILVLLAFATAHTSQAAVISYNLIGKAGPGLLFLNEPSVVSGGSGGEVGAGIFFDDVSKVLTINVAWGSANGFSDLTTAATNAHVHTTAADFGNTASGNWTDTGSVVFGLTASPFTYNASASAGSISGSIVLTAAQEASLANSRYYINVHTLAPNNGGEIRGFLTPVPEPASTGILLGTAALLAGRRRRNA